jgi:hypothetical protein
MTSKTLTAALLALALIALIGCAGASSSLNLQFQDGKPSISSTSQGSVSK